MTAAKRIRLVSNKEEGEINWFLRKYIHGKDSRFNAFARRISPNDCQKILSRLLADGMIFDWDMDQEVNEAKK